MMLLGVDLATAVLLDKVQKGKGDQMSEPALKMPGKRKLVEGRKSHFYVSKMVAKATNQEVNHMIICDAFWHSEFNLCSLHQLFYSISLVIMSPKF